MMAEDLVRSSTQEGMAILEITNPPANTYNLELLQQLDTAIVEARLNPDVHAILLRGAGEKFFSAGAEIKFIQEASPEARYNFSLFGHETLNRLENTPKLVVAALNGHTVGGGLEIAMACDLRVAKKDGGRIGLAEVNLGVLPGMGGTQRLPRLVGRSRALELAATGATISFEDAYDLGLVNQVFERDSFWDEVMAYVKQFIPPHKSSFAVGRIKRAIQSGIESSLNEGLALEREVLAQAFASEDAAEGMKAYLEKRAPKFKGR
ncbi:MAG: enoyl-CoA hydratase-related protein [Candidatus Acidoferrales bacterium]